MTIEKVTAHGLHFNLDHHKMVSGVTLRVEACGGCKSDLGPRGLYLSLTSSKGEQVYGRLGPDEVVAIINFAFGALGINQRVVDANLPATATIDVPPKPWDCDTFGLKTMCDTCGHNWGKHIAVTALCSACEACTGFIPFTHVTS